jgi:arsenate reductase
MARDLEDEEAKLDCYRRVRDQIRAFVETLPEALFNSYPENGA